MQIREKTIISILVNKPEMYSIIKEKLSPNDFKDEENREIISKIYEKCQMGVNDININSILDYFNEEVQNKLTGIMTEDYGITDNKKALEDILIKYEREDLEQQRDSLLEKIGQENISGLCLATRHKQYNQKMTTWN